MNGEVHSTQKRALAVFTVIAIVFGAYFLRGYFILVVAAAVGAYLFTPLFTWLTKRLNSGVSATLTLLAALLAVVIPATLFVLLATVQITQMVKSVAQLGGGPDLSTLGDKTLRTVNEMLARLPLLHVNVTQERLQKRIRRPRSTSVSGCCSSWRLPREASSARSRRRSSSCTCSYRCW